ncbi:class I SAM-dependent methyltransferase [soil metagenome]
MTKKGKTPKGTSPLGLPALLLETLSHFIEDGNAADRSLNETFRKYKIRDQEQRSELALRFYGIIRFWRPLVTALGEDKFETPEQIRKLIGAWNAWKKIYAGEKQENLKGPVAERLNKYMRVRKLRESFPDWLDAFAVEQLGEKNWEEMAAALNKEPKLYLRTNTLKIKRELLMQKLKAEGVEVFMHNDSPDALIVKVYANVFATESFHEGMFEVQDIASQRVSAFLEAEPGMRVADACAGNGGKTLHLAALMQNKGKIVSMDIVQNKLDELRARCTRNGVDLVETKLVNKQDVILKMEGTFDRVLLDVPCTGSGVLRRNPDIRWRLFPEDVSEMVNKQKEILREYSVLVKSGGKLVYATCSIFPIEGEEQIKQFLESNADFWEMEEELRINPVLDDGDGFYLARLKKK